MTDDEPLTLDHDGFGLGGGVGRIRVAFREAVLAAYDTSSTMSVLHSACAPVW
jgi:hypothetical protein